jgi:signal transduction histidine kinase
MITPTDILHGKVLIVDDQEVNVLLLERMLRGAGYVAVSSTTDPGAVCELHAEHAYDLILLDLEMPGMDGFQVMEALKKIESGSYLPVLAVTAQPAHKLRALQGGAKDFISKPFDLPEALMRIHNMLEVRLLHKQAEDLNQFKTNLVSVVSHEVANALGIMKIATFLLQEKLPPEWLKDSNRLFDMILTNIDGLTRAVQNLLNMGRLEAGKLAIDFAATDAAEILRTALQRMELLCEKKALRVSLDLPDDLQPVRADPASLTLVISNLLSNAVKYTPENGSIVLGILADAAHPGYYRIYVQDTGIGVSEEDRTKILNGHYRSESGRKMTSKGYGVGLSLAQQIVEAHDSSIQIGGGPGKGSRFSFLLPTSPNSAVSGQASPPCDDPAKLA